MHMPMFEDPHIGPRIITVENAKALAQAEHGIQVDKIGNPYIEHVAWVAERARRHGPIVEMVAWLHDVVEDCGVKLDALAWLGYPDVVVAAVDAITRRNTETYTEYIQRVATNPIACIVKLIDLDHNTLPHRVARLQPAEASSLGRRYTRAKKHLLEARVAHLESFAQFMISLDDPDGPGFDERRSITMNRIISRAREAFVTHEHYESDKSDKSG